MRYRLLGHTGLYVSELSLGSMTFGGGPFWEAIGTLDENAATAIVKSAIDAGVNLIDTADVYADGLSEQIVGRAVARLGVARDSILIATKVHERMAAHPNGGGSTRLRILAGIDASLARLGVDHVDLYQVHGVDPVTDVAETLDALDAVVRSGKARYVGVCNFPAWRLQKAVGVAAERHAPAPVSQQVYYSLAGRDAERAILPQAIDAGIGVLVWSPLAGGMLSGRIDPLAPSAGPVDARRTAFDFPPIDAERTARIIATARVIADEHSASAAQVALAWLLTRPGVTSVIVGAKSIAQLSENLGAGELARALTSDQIARLDAVSALPVEYPGWMVDYQAAARIPGGERPMADDGQDVRRARGLAILETLFGGEPPTTPVNRDLMAISTQHLFGDIWSRPGLSLRDRELVTVSVIAALGFERQLRLHLRGAIAAGITRAELIEVFVHLAHYSGYPSGFTALAVAHEVFEQIDGEGAPG